MKKRTKLYSYGDIEFILDAMDRGMTQRMIAKELTRTRAAINAICSLYNRWQRSPAEAERVSRRTCQHFKTYTQKKAGEMVADNSTLGAALGVAPAPVQTDHFDKLSLAFKQFQSEIEIFLDKEVSQRSKARVEALEEEIRLLKEAFEVAKNDNWLEALKKRWANQGTIQSS